ncbi:bifunctional transcriptional activator/DNA repair enzyme AdaA [Streptomyces sp. NPDC088785]|uniref:bifunctional transcriptional activator/DNA repair enzyme AdaA n=1 Tax=Streptomyces sp. NPDC088785 TaxID=3365897 RepID=UPI0038150F1A
MSRPSPPAPASAVAAPWDPRGDALDEEARWQAVTLRDRRADGAFCYGVRTTGTYSRPSCTARRPRRANTVFFADERQALAAGFRPCRRCRPEAGTPAARGVRAAVRACRRMEEPRPLPGLEDLARAVGFSSFHFHRLFTRTIGVTPMTYVQACRADRLHHTLRSAPTVTEAIYRCGFNSTGNFYAHADALLGMTPTAFRNQGEGMAIRYALTPHDRGHLLAAATSSGVCAVLCGRDRAALLAQVRHRYPAALVLTPDAGLGDRLARILHRRPPVASGVPADVRERALHGRVRKLLGPHGPTP